MRKVAWRTVLLAGLASVNLAIAGCAGGPFPFSQEWYAERAGDPPGTRQIDSHGKLWPPYPRPVGRKQTKLHAYHYAHYWPYPQNCEDEAYVRNIIDLQAGTSQCTDAPSTAYSVKKTQASPELEIAAGLLGELILDDEVLHAQAHGIAHAHLQGEEQFMREEDLAALEVRALIGRPGEFEGPYQRVLG